MCRQKSPMAKGRLEAAFARLDRLGLGEDCEDLVDPQESMRQVDLFMLVTSTPPE